MTVNPPATGRDLVSRRHVEWIENRVHWQWMLDSYEGGERYRTAVYGRDRRGLPVRNLVRHKREYPDPQADPGYVQGMQGVPSSSIDVAGQGWGGAIPGFLGADPNATAADDDYELRRARTPVPGWVEDCVETHLGKIFDQEVKRPEDQNPKELVAWWEDVDGRGTPVDEWMSGVIAPLLMTLGQLDVLFDHPPPPDGQAIETRADELRLGLDGCIASYILPENMVWHRLDPAGSRYVECLVMEYEDPSGWTRGPSSQDEAIAWNRRHGRFRHWTDRDWTLYDYDGNRLDGRPHAFGRVPIVRLIDGRRHRTPHVGKSRYEGVAGHMREYYNRDSELILSDSIQAHPILSLPEEYCSGDRTIPVGPGYLIPMKKCVDGSYQAPMFIAPSKDPAESIRKNKADIADQKDQLAKLTKPAGAAGTTGNSVAQSGVSKQLDATSGNKFLTRVARSLAKAERQVAEMALLVMGVKGDVKVIYPSRFELFAVADLVAGITEFQLAVAQAGEAPLAEKLLLQSLERLLLLGLEDEEYADLDAELDGILEAKAKAKDAYEEASLAGALALQSGAGVESEDGDGSGTAESGSQADPSGASNATSVSNTLSLQP